MCDSVCTSIRAAPSDEGGFQERWDWDIPGPAAGLHQLDRGDRDFQGAVKKQYEEDRSQDVAELIQRSAKPWSCLVEI